MKRIGINFDCVEMKDAIQARSIVRRRGMSSVKFVADVEQTLARSTTPIAEFWRRISVGEHSKTRGRVTDGKSP